MANVISAINHHKKISFVVLAIILVGIYFFVVPSGKNASATIYTYGTAAKGNIVQSVSGSGQVSASDQIDVKTQVSGTLAALNAIQGKSVESGDVLAQLDAADARAAVDLAQANLVSAKLSLQQTDQNNSLSVTQAQQDLQQANDSLLQSKNSLKTTYEQAFNTLSSTFADLPLVMTDMDNIINGSNSAVLQTSGTYLNYYEDQITHYGSSTSSLLDLGATYNAALSSYNNVLAEYKGASRYSGPATISKLVNKFKYIISLH